MKIFYAIFGILFIILNVMLVCTPDRNEYGEAVHFIEYWATE